MTNIRFVSFPFSILFPLHRRCCSVGKRIRNTCTRERPRTGGGRAYVRTHPTSTRCALIPSCTFHFTPTLPSLSLRCTPPLRRPRYLAHASCSDVRPKPVHEARRLHYAIMLRSVGEPRRRPLWACQAEGRGGAPGSGRPCLCTVRVEDRSVAVTASTTLRNTIGDDDAGND